jgi:hypothetical protein
MAADDAARRSGLAPAGLNPLSRAWPSMRLLSVGFGSKAEKLAASKSGPLHTQQRTLCKPVVWSATGRMQTRRKL